MDGCFFAEPEAEGLDRFIDVMDRREMLYLEIARAHVDYSKCLINIIFYHTLLKRNVFLAKFIIICFDSGKMVSSLDIRPGNNVIVREELEDLIKYQVEEVFGRFFFTRNNNVG